MTYFFMTVRRVFSKSKGPVVGTKIVSNDSESSTVSGPRGDADWWVSMRRSWLTPSWSKWLSETREHDDFS